MSHFINEFEIIRTCAWAGAIFLLGLLVYTSSRSRREYNAIPAIGRTGFFSSYLSVIEAFKNSKGMVQEGYNKYNPGVFRMPELTRWRLVVTGSTLIEELRRAPEDVFSLEAALADVIEQDYTLAPNVHSNPYHLDIIRSGMTARHVASVFPEVRDEVMHAFEDIIPQTDDWTKHKVLGASQKIVARTSNRLFMGVPTCRDPEYIALNVQFTMDAFMAAKMISLFPRFLKPAIGALLPLFSNVPKLVQTGMNHLGPVIEERQRKIHEYGSDYPDKPDDLLTWLMDEATGEERSIRNITLRVLLINVAAIHVTSMAFTHALFDLTSRPEYIQPIREEVEAAIAEEGWTKVAIARMRKLDSFLKESQRLAIGTDTMTRIALKEFTFSDGTRIPKGAFVSVASRARHTDDNVCHNAAVFDGFRFSNKSTEEGEGVKNQLVTTSTDILTFGYGKHACPGRFFAAHELKAMMAHLLMNYDVKLENEGVRPEDQWYFFACTPNSQAEVLFRKRKH